MARRFVCNKPAAHQIYALSLHDALPISLAPIGLAMYDHWDRSPVSKSACHNSSACAPVLNSIKPAKTVVGSAEDRKSTRLNSSHVRISYAVFCLKKKNIAKVSNQLSCCI